MRGNITERDTLAKFQPIGRFEKKKGSLISPWREKKGKRAYILISFWKKTERSAPTIEGVVPRHGENRTSDRGFETGKGRKKGEGGPSTSVISMG